MPYQNSFTTIKWNFKKIHHQLFNNQLIELSSSSEIDNIIQEGEVIFKKNPTVGLLEVSKLTDSAINKRQRDQRKHSFLEKKKYSIKGKMDSLWTLRNITWLVRSCYEAIDSSISQKIFSYLKLFSMQCRKNIAVEDNKKKNEYS